MEMNRLFSLMLTFLFLPGIFSCTSESQEEKELEHALEFAAGNRNELEAVLRYYADDSLKLKAAKYLICNMPGHYSYVDTVISRQYAQAVDSVLNAMKGERD